MPTEMEWEGKSEMNEEVMELTFEESATPPQRPRLAAEGPPGCPSQKL